MAHGGALSRPANDPEGLTISTLWTSFRFKNRIIFVSRWGLYDWEHRPWLSKTWLFGYCIQVAEVK